MKKKYRIKRNEDFQAILHNRKFRGSKNFVVYTKDKEETYQRIGISVPKKTGNAVTRNKIKRQVKEIIRPLDLKNKNKDLIIMVKRTYLKASFEENRKDLENLLKQVKM